MIRILPEDEAKVIVGNAFVMHDACGCGRITHALAAAAHDILTAEYKALANSRTGGRMRLGVDASVDRVWNGQGDASVRLVQSTHWRALWLAYEAGLIRLEATS